MSGSGIHKSISYKLRDKYLNGRLIPLEDIITQDMETQIISVFDEKYSMNTERL